MPDGPYDVSVMTELERLSYPSLSAAEEQRIRQFLLQVVVVDLTPDVRRRAVHLRRTHRVRLPDAIIAATALSLGVELLTSDLRLARIPGLPHRIVQPQVVR